MGPVGGAVAGTGEAVGLHEGLPEPGTAAAAPAGTQEDRRVRPTAGGQVGQRSRPRSAPPSRRGAEPRHGQHDRVLPAAPSGDRRAVVPAAPAVRRGRRPRLGCDAERGMRSMPPCPSVVTQWRRGDRQCSEQLLVRAARLSTTLAGEARGTRASRRSRARWSTRPAWACRYGLPSARVDPPPFQRVEQTEQRRAAPLRAVVACAPPPGRAARQAWPPAGPALGTASPREATSLLPFGPLLNERRVGRRVLRGLISTSRRSSFK